MLGIFARLQVAEEESCVIKPFIIKDKGITDEHLDIIMASTSHAFLMYHVIYTPKERGTK